MKRTPMKRTGFARRVLVPDQVLSPLPHKPKAKPRKPMKQRSAKRAALYAGPDGRVAFRAAVLADHPRCQAGVRIGWYLLGMPAWASSERSYRAVAGCTVDSVDVHEILARSAGGSILDRANVLAVCRTCHTWIGDHPKEALTLGLRRSRYAGRNPPPLALPEPT